MDFENITDDLYIDLQQTVRDESKMLVKLEGWMHIKQQHLPYIWMARWCVVKHGYILWSDRQITIQNMVDKEEKRRWNNCINLTRIITVSQIKSKKNKTFQMNVIGINKAYTFKGKTKEIRDKWFKGIHEHIEHIRQAAMVCGHSLEKSEFKNSMLGD